MTVSGDTLLAPAGDMRVEMATLSGDLESELDGLTESRRGYRALRVGSGEPLLELRSMSGDLRIVRPTAIPARTTPSGEGAQGPSVPAAEASSAAGPTPAQANGAIAAAYEDARLRVLRSLERGEIDVEEAGLRLEALDRGPGGPDAPTERVTDA